MARRNILDRLTELESKSDDADFRKAVAEVEEWFRNMQDRYEYEERAKNEEHTRTIG